jgi:hypothetical protein
MAVPRLGPGDKAFFYASSILLAFLLLSSRALVLYVFTSALVILCHLRNEKKHWSRMGVASPDGVSLFFGHMLQLFRDGAHGFDIANCKLLGDTHG